ncbi:hypothetical protein CHUAL_000568 [Chamberlinius hualienensis]
MIVHNRSCICIVCCRRHQCLKGERSWLKMMIAAFSKSSGNKLNRTPRKTQFLVCSGYNSQSNNSFGELLDNNNMGVNKGLGGRLCSWLNQCVILGLFLPLAFLIIVADKDSLHEGSVRAINSAVSSASGMGSSKSKPARFNTLFEEGHVDKSQQRPYFDNTTINNVTIQEGRTAYLSCRVRQLGDRTVSWIRRKDYHILTSGHFTYTTDQRFQSLPLENTGDWTLQIKYAQKRDAGIYECQVTWEKGVISWFVTLNVVVPKATINSGLKDYYIKSGSTITLNCIITDSPDPSYVFWYHNERMINYDSLRGGIQVKTETGTVTTSSLYVADAQHADSGNYTCSSADALPTSITVHVLNGDKSAAMQHEGQKSKARSVSLRPWSGVTVLWLLGQLFQSLLWCYCESLFVLR